MPDDLISFIMLNNFQMSGIAVCVKQKNRDKASVTRIISVTIGSSHRKRGFTLTPGVKSNWRRTNVSGAAIGDVPAKYTITGLESFELPVVGTYVDPRIVPGFRYKVRVAGSKGRLFNGQALRLNSIGMGYAKRITFECDPNNLNESQNHFWSDSNPDGYGLVYRPATRSAQICRCCKTGCFSDSNRLLSTEECSS